MYTNTKLSFMTIMIVSVLGVIAVGMIPSAPTVQAVKCEDISGTDKWNGEAHDDNNPSESKFHKMIFKEKATTCEVAKCYDMENCKGTIEKDDYDKFKTTFVYEATSDDVQDCFDHRMDLGGELKDYEIHHCAVGSY